nr:MAG TPA: hypothetical protein [Caudoviricetes sp.]
MTLSSEGLITLTQHLYCRNLYIRRFRMLILLCARVFVLRRMEATLPLRCILQIGDISSIYMLACKSLKKGLRQERVTKTQNFRSIPKSKFLNAIPR